MPVNRELNADRVDGRLFIDGPLDRFTTTREVELMGLDDEPVVIDPDINNDETVEMPAISAPELGKHELVAQQDDRVEPGAGATTG